MKRSEEVHHRETAESETENIGFYRKIPKKYKYLQNKRKNSVILIS